MTEKINKYETIFVLDSTKTEDEITALVEKFKSLIEANGEIESVDEWGKRRLAYPINDLTEGYYVLINFKSGTDFPAELERVYGITEGVIRDIVIKSEEA
ncbi:MAG: 30S ribosomal protein S6 [Eubacteriales bacterium]|jgi:ribosomal protein S6|nr:30S ribosomal protein S6 [Eubacteriales bacterium]MDO5587102.1 30S ribosomal protein S6 [Clostridia bacterium]MDY4212454.1 30S ribosomal protein S6 [Eubacteriales bacterium]MDY5231613.1 30S ribosomal protein S6 [Eubacteriales bacterium]